jgi:hypothetical protein
MMTSDSTSVPAATEIRGNQVQVKVEQHVITVKSINKRLFLMKQMLREIVRRSFFARVELPPQTLPGPSFSTCYDPLWITLRIKGAKKISFLGTNVCTNYNYNPPKHQQMQNYWIVGSGETIIVQDVVWYRREYVLWLGRNWKDLLDTAAKVSVIVSAVLEALYRLRVLLLRPAWMRGTS